ncbi:MAG TPA: hypothetical protein PLK11_06720 [Methanofastidiosum sp.]|nr:hypothetical protein [Methanofastidiosum sp.]HQF89586.1 hypothetical protein [Methanofastidiosum sp.]HQK85249.1 hypothetical protein [Methanofastidiosum sp.]
MHNIPGPKIKAMGNNLTQTRLDFFYRIQVQKTIPEFISIRKMKVYDKRIRIASTKNDCESITCPHIKRSHVSRSFSYIRCSYSGNSKKQSPGPCHICPMKKIRNIWIPVRTECRDKEWKVMPSNKFWNWKKE